MSQYGYPTMPYQQGYNPYPGGYNPIEANAQRIQQIAQQNPHLMQQYQQGYPQGYPQSAQAQQMQQAQQQQPALKGRAVTGIEEVRAAQIDFDGSLHIFPDSGGGRIYTKRIGSNGAGVYETYVLQAPEDVPQVAQTAQTMPGADIMAQAIAALGALSARFDALEGKIDTMMGGAQDAVVANYATGRGGTKQRKSDGDAAADGGR